MRLQVRENRTFVHAFNILSSSLPDTACAYNAPVLLCPVSDLSAFLRRIDLVTNLVAPIVTGQVITYGSSVIGAVFLGGWNLFFMFIEYSLLYAIYKRVPELAVKNSAGTSSVIPQLTGRCLSLHLHFILTKTVSTIRTVN